MKRVIFFCIVAGCVLAADVISLDGLPEGRWVHPQPPSSEAGASPHSLLPPSERSAFPVVLPTTSVMPPPMAATSADRTTTQPSPPRGRSSSSVIPPHDSTHRSVSAGSVLITTLPEQVAGRTVTGYDMLHTPALSDVAGRSFFWRTRPRDEGRHRLLFRPRLADSTAAADTLALVVTVRPATDDAGTNDGP